MVPLVYLGFTKSIPFRPHYEIKAVFESSNNLKKASPVRIAGVEVGRVTKVERVKQGGESVVVTMRIGKAGRPIHDDARAKIRPRIFLEGNFFVDIEPGTPGAAEIEDDQTIPINQTAVPVQLDQILTSLQSDTREDLKTLLDEYGNALDKGGAEAFNRSIPYWKSAYRDTAIVNEASLGEAEHDLSGYIKGAGATAAALDRNAGQLKSLITDFNTTAGAFAREQDNLRSAIAELPRTLRAGQPALAALNESFPPLRALRAATCARACSPPRPRSTRRSRSCASCAGSSPRTSCAGWPPTCGRPSRRWPASRARASRSPSRAACSPAARTRSSCRGARTRSSDEQFPASGPVYTEAPKAFPGLAGESRSGDANGQWFRVLAAGGTNLVTLAPGVFGTTTEPDPRRQPAQAEGAPAAGREQALRDPGDRRTCAASPAPRPSSTRSTRAPTPFKERYALARGRAVDWLKKQLKLEDLDRQAEDQRQGRHQGAARLDRAARRQP